jgi:hypothetical protein
MAARYAKDMQIIELLLKNIKDEEINRNDAALLASASINEQGLDGKIVARLIEKSIVKPELDVEIIGTLSAKMEGYGMNVGIISCKDDGSHRRHS